jgi:hypothetical protein
MRRLTILVTSPLLLLALAACGEPAKGPGVASADGGATPTSSASATSQGDPVKFADCMREHGIEVEVQSDGKGIGIKGKPGDASKMDEAQRECRKYAPGGGDGQGKPMSKADQEKFLKFAQCMRDHGIPMEDPKFEGGGVRLSIGGDKGQPRLDDAKVEAAQKACQSNLPAEMREGPGGGDGPASGGGPGGAGGTTGGGA